jgi:hypothetical protein
MSISSVALWHLTSSHSQAPRLQQHRQQQQQRTAAAAALKVYWQLLQQQ